MPPDKRKHTDDDEYTPSSEDDTDSNEDDTHVPSTSHAQPSRVRTRRHVAPSASHARPSTRKASAPPPLPKRQGNQRPQILITTIQYHKNYNHEEDIVTLENEISFFVIEHDVQRIIGLPRGPRPIVIRNSNQYTERARLWRDQFRQKVGDL